MNKHLYKNQFFTDSSTKYDRIIQYIIFIILLSGVVSGLLISFNKFEWADDFSFMMALKDKNIFNWVWERYLTFDGRHLSLWGVIQAFNIKYLPTQLTIAIYYLLFCFAITIFIKSELKINFKNKINEINLYMTFILSYLFVFKAHAFETIYWAVGGFYSLVLFGLAIWYWLFLKLPNNHNNSTNFFFAFATLMIGTTTQNLTAGVLFLLIFQLVFQNIVGRKQVYLPIILLLIGVIFISIAPGNAARGLNLKDSMNFTVLLNNLESGLMLYFKSSKGLFLISFPLSLLIWSKNIINKNEGIIRFFMFFGAAMATIMPLLLAPKGIISLRTSIYFQFFFFISLIYFFTYILYLFFGIFTKQNYFQVLTFGFVVFISLFPILNFKNSFGIAKSYRIREKQIIENPIKTNLEINRITPSLAPYHCLNYFKDITDDANFWRNQAFARYYGYDKAISY